MYEKKPSFRWALRPSKNPLKGLFRRTTALRALIAGYADNSHTCAVSSVFCPGRPVAKNGFQKPTSRAKPIFSTS